MRGRDSGDGEQAGARPRCSSSRGQSSVIGVALLVGITMLALGTMAAAVGGVVDDAATDADIRRVTADFERSFRPVEATGLHRGRIEFGEGSLTTEPRTVRLLDATGIVETHDTAAVIYRANPGLDSNTGGRRVTFLAGAILVTQGDYTTVVRPPPMASGPGVLVLGLPVVRGDVGIGGRRLTLRVTTNVNHTRQTIGEGNWRVAVETTSPDAWNRTLTRRGGQPRDRRDFDGDGIDSVVAGFPNPRTAHLVIHDVELEVRQ